MKAIALMPRRARLGLAVVCVVSLALLMASFWSYMTTGTAAFWRNPSPPQGAVQAVVIVLRQGANPVAVAERIAGSNAYLRRGGQDQSGHWWFSVPIAPGHESAALLQAQSDPSVYQAFLVDWPSDRKM